MADKFNYALLLPSRTLAEGEADMLIAPGAEGDFGVLKGHMEMVTKLRPGKVEVRNEQKREVYVISGGFADVGGDKCLLMAEKGEAAGRLNPTEVKKQLAALGEEEHSERKFLEAMLEAGA